MTAFSTQYLLASKQQRSNAGICRFLLRFQALTLHHSSVYVCVYLFDMEAVAKF